MGGIRTEVNDETHAAIAELNPFRYRTYYYDTETNLYYLNTRYYDPEVGRFISQDDVSYLDPEHINGLNLFAYCGNNPVMNVDYNGTFAITALLIGLIVGAIIGAIVGGVAAYSVAKDCDATGWELAGWTILGVFGGALIGGAIGAGLGAAAGVIFPSINAALASSLSITLPAWMSLSATSGALAMGSATVFVPVGALAVAGAAVTGVGVGIGISFMGKPNSGRIRYSDGTGTNPDGSKMTQKQAEEAYNSSKDPVYRAKLKRWMKGQGYRRSHLHGLVFLPLVGEWLRRIFTADYD